LIPAISVCAVILRAFSFWTKNRRGYTRCDARDFEYDHKDPTGKYGSDVTERMRCWRKIAKEPERLGVGFVPFGLT
jgi:hypothetical protein